MVDKMLARRFLAGTSFVNFVLSAIVPIRLEHTQKPSRPPKQLFGTLPFPAKGPLTGNCLQLVDGAGGLHPNP